MKTKRFFAFLIVFTVVFIAASMALNYYTDNFIITPLKQNIMFPAKISYLIYKLKPKIIIASIIGQLEAGISIILSMFVIKLIESPHNKRQS